MKTNNFVSYMAHSLTEDQIMAAQALVPEGCVIEEKSPVQINPEWGKEDIENLAKAEFERIKLKDPKYVLLAGEPSLTFALVQMCKEANITALCATTKRESIETTQPDGSVVKTNVFRHVRFREF